MTRRAGLASVMAALVFFAGCASLPHKKWGKGATAGALIGGTIGGGAGVGVSEAAGDRGTPELARGGLIGAAVGIIVGGLVGHYLYDEDVQAVPPPPEAAPAEAAPPPAAQVVEEGALIAVVDVSGFGLNQSVIPPSAYPALDKVVAQLAQRPSGERLVLEGYTDSLGSEEYNYRLGLRRADAVRAYLAAHGIPADRMTVRSKGKLDPVASNDTPEGRAKNRRVEIHSGGMRSGTAPATQGAP